MCRLEVAHPLDGLNHPHAIEEVVTLRVIKPCAAKSATVPPSFGAEFLCVPNLRKSVTTRDAGSCITSYKTIITYAPTMQPDTITRAFPS